MAAKRDEYSQIADLLRKLFSAEHGKAKTIFTGTVFIGATLLGFDRFGAAVALILAGTTAAVAFALLASVLEGWQKLMSRRRSPEQRFKALLPDLEALFRTIDDDAGADPLELDRLTLELRGIGLWMIQNENLEDPRQLRTLIVGARRGNLDKGLLRKYAPF